MLLTEEVLQPVHNKIIKTAVHTVNPDNIQAQPLETHSINKNDLAKPIWSNESMAENEPFIILKIVRAF